MQISFFAICMRFTACFLVMGLTACSPDRIQFQSIDITGADYAKGFTLTDHNDQRRSLSDFKGKVVVLFFGYTQCPDVCPTSMAELAEAVGQAYGVDTVGRVTWQSIPEKFRPLPGRTNVVVSRQTGFSAPGAQVVGSLQAAMDLFTDKEVVWLIGGAQLYAQAMPLAQQLVITEIDADYEGDAFAPVLNTAEWTEIQRTSHTSAQGLGYSLVTLQKR